MSSAGHVLDMISRMKNAAASKKERKEKTRKINELFLKDGWNPLNNHLRETDISDERLGEIKMQIKSASTKERRFRLIFTLIITFLACLSLITIGYWNFFR